MKTCSCSELKEGWAIKKPSGNTLFKGARDFAEREFNRLRSMVPPMRAEPRAIAQMIEDSVNPDGSFQFKVLQLHDLV